MSNPLRTLRRLLAERRVDKLHEEMMRHTHGCGFDDCPLWGLLCAAYDDALDRARALS